MTSPPPPNQPPYGNQPGNQPPYQQGGQPQYQQGGQPQYQQGGQPQYQQGGQPQYQQGGQPYQPGPMPGPPRRKSPIKRIIGGIVVLGIIVVAVLGYLASKSSPDAAKAGDCVARKSGNDVKIVKCTDSTAAYKVVGKVNDKTQVQFNISSQTICKPFAGSTSAFWRGEQGGKGYVLCLSANK